MALNANLRLVRNVANQATLTDGAGIDPAFPSVNLANEKRVQVCRTAPSVGGSADLSVKGVFPEDRVVGCVGLARHNAAATGTFEVLLYSDAGFTTLVDSTIILADPGSIYVGYPNNLFLAWFDHKTVRSFQVDLIDSATPVGGYLEAASLIIGDFISPAINPNWGAALSWFDPGEQVRTEGGSVLSEKRERFRKLDLQFDFLIDAETEFFSELDRTGGIHQSLLVSLYPQDADQAKLRRHQFFCKQDGGGGSPIALPPNVAQFVNQNQRKLSLIEI